MLLKSSPLTRGGGGGRGRWGAAGGKSFHVDNDYRWWDLWGGVRAQINTSTVAGGRGPIRPVPRSRPGRVAVQPGPGEPAARGRPSGLHPSHPARTRPRGPAWGSSRAPSSPAGCSPGTAADTDASGRGGRGGGRGFPGLGKGPLGPNPPHQGNRVWRSKLYRDVFGENGPAPCRTSAPSCSLSGLRPGTSRRLGGPGGAGRGRGGSVPLPHGSAPSVARLKSGRCRVGSPPAEGLRERVPQTREERKGERESPGPSLPLLPSW